MKTVIKAITAILLFTFLFSIVSCASQKGGYRSTGACKGTHGKVGY